MRLSGALNAKAGRDVHCVLLIRGVLLLDDVRVFNANALNYLNPRVILWKCVWFAVCALIVYNEFTGKRFLARILNSYQLKSKEVSVIDLCDNTLLSHFECKPNRAAN